MKSLSAKQVILFTAFLGCFPLTLGAPTPGATDVVDSGVDSRSDANEFLGPADEIKIVPHDDDDLYFAKLLNLTKLMTRVDPEPVIPESVDPEPVAGGDTEPEPEGGVGTAAPAGGSTSPVPDTVGVGDGTVPAPPDWTAIPAGTKPGFGPGLGNKPQTMSVYEDAGESALSSYINVIKTNKADTKIVDTVQDVQAAPKNTAFQDWTKNEGYEEVTKPDMKLFDNYVSLSLFTSSQTGFVIPQKATQIICKNAKQPLDDVYVNRGTYDPAGAFIVFQDAFKSNNRVADPVPINEIGMQNYLRVAGQNANNLRGAILTDIQNQEFWAIVVQNYNDMKQPLTKILTFKTGTIQFNRFMGSPNLKSKFLGFSNHHQQMGNKFPNSITIIPAQAGNTNGQLTAAVTFGTYSAV